MIDRIIRQRLKGVAIEVVVDMEHWRCRMDDNVGDKDETDADGGDGDEQWGLCK